MHKKSVLMVVAKYPATYGHTTVINNLCKSLNEIGYHAAIGAFSFDKDPPNNIEKVKLSKLKLLTKGISYLDFDIIHSHQSRVNYYLLAKKPTKPVILHYHGASSKIQQINFKISMWLFGNRISKIISVSYAGVNQMKKMIKKVNADVIYNGVDTNFYNPNLSTKYRKGIPQLLFVSALRKYKNTSFLVRSMKKILEKYPSCNLQIVGYGEDYELLKNLISQLGLEKNVELTGKITDDELRIRYSSCDLYVSASSFEVCPVPPFEAMACGKPILLYDIEPHREIVEASKAGMMFTNLSDSEICEAISKIYESKTSYGDLGRKFAEEHDWLSISKQLTKIYEKI